MRDIYTLSEHQTGRQVPGGKRFRTRLKLNWKVVLARPEQL